MKKTILISILALTTCATAQWAPVGVNTNTGAVKPEVPFTFQTGTTQALAEASAHTMTLRGECVVTNASEGDPSSPDCTGTYIDTGMTHNDGPVFYCPENGYFISKRDSITYYYYVISATIGDGATAPYWQSSSEDSPDGTFSAIEGISDGDVVSDWSPSKILTTDNVVTGVTNLGTSGTTGTVQNVNGNIQIRFPAISNWASFAANAAVNLAGNNLTNGGAGYFDSLYVDGTNILDLLGSGDGAAPSTISCNIVFDPQGAYSTGTLHVIVYNSSDMLGNGLTHVTTNITSAVSSTTVTLANKAEYVPRVWIFAWMDSDSDGIFNAQYMTYTGVAESDVTYYYQHREQAALAEFNPQEVPLVTSAVSVNIYLCSVKGGVYRAGWPSDFGTRLIYDPTDLYPYDDPVSDPRTWDLFSFYGLAGDYGAHVYTDRNFIHEGDYIRTNQTYLWSYNPDLIPTVGGTPKPSSEVCLNANGGYHSLLNGSKSATITAAGKPPQDNLYFGGWLSYPVKPVYRANPPDFQYYEDGGSYRWTHVLTLGWRPQSISPLNNEVVSSSNEIEFVMGNVFREHSAIELEVYQNWGASPGKVYSYIGYMENFHTDGSVHHKMRPYYGGPDLLPGSNYYWRVRSRLADITAASPASYWSDATYATFWVMSIDEAYTPPSGPSAQGDGFSDEYLLYTNGTVVLGGTEFVVNTGSEVRYGEAGVGMDAYVTAVESNVTSLVCDGFGLDGTLYLTNIPFLVSLSCYGNAFTNLDFSSSYYLSTLNCNTNELVSLNLVNSEYLSELRCSSNKLTEVTLGYMPYLSYVDCSSNFLTEASVDDILLKLTAASVLDGFCDLSGVSNAPPSTNGLVYKGVLESNNWSVVVTP